MTVSYTSEVATSTFGCFVKLLFRWRGSIYKLIWKDFLVYIILYYLVRIVYRFALTEKGQRNFESLAKYSDAYVSLIPLSFVLGFYVQQVVARWHQQFQTIPYPDSTAVLVTANVKGLDERGRLIRRTMMRYLMLGYVMTMRSIAPLVKKRFPTMKHLTQAGLMSTQEEKILESIKVSFNKYSIPLIWATSLVSLARKEGRIYDDYAVAVLNDSFNTVRQQLNRLFLFDWVGIPLVYTQVVTLSVYLYFVLTLFSQQFLLQREGIVGKDVDLIIPLAAILQFFFFMGWLKVAETLINPFGEDDDDFDINSYIDRNIQLSYLAVDGMHADHPLLVKDMYWGTQQFELPYTEATLDQRRQSVTHDQEMEAGSAAGVTVPESKSSFIQVENSLSELTKRKSGRRLFETDVKRVDSKQAKLEKSESVGKQDKSEKRENLEKLKNSKKPETAEKSGNAETLKKKKTVEEGETVEKQAKQPMQEVLDDLEMVKEVEILQTPDTPDDHVYAKLRRNETAPSDIATEKASLSPVLSMDEEEEEEEEVESETWDEALQEEEDVKPLKVIDLPISPSAVTHQRRKSFFQHMDKVRQSLTKESERESTQVRQATSGATVAMKSIRLILTGNEGQSSSETNVSKSKSQVRETKADSVTSGY